MLGGGIVGDGGRLGEMLGEMLGGGGEIRGGGVNKAISDEKLSAKRVMKEGGRCNIFELKETRTNERKMEELYLSKGGKVTALGRSTNFPLVRRGGVGKVEFA